MTDQLLSSKATASPASSDTLVGVTAGGLVRRFTFAAIGPLLQLTLGTVQRALTAILGDADINPVNYGADPTGA